jgi:hypothetical protein
MEAGAAGAFGLFLFLAVGAVALFSMVAVTTWADARRKERESYYKNDMLKKVSEAGPGASSALEMMREEVRIAAAHTRQGLRIAGLVTTAAGIGVLIFLRALLGGQPVYLCGLIPLLVGLALYASSYLVMTTQ